MTFQNLFSKLIHPSIQKDELLYVKAKTLLLLLMFLLLILVAYTSFFVINGVFYNPKAFLNYLGLIIIITSLFLLKKSTQLNYPLRVINFASLFLITGGVYWSGGFSSNDIFWYIIASTASLLFISKLDGLIMTLLSILAMFIFYIIDVKNIVYLPIDPLTNSIHYRFANALVIIIILFFLMWLLVNRNNRLQKIIQDIQNSQIRETISQDFHDELGNKLASVVHLSKRLKHSTNEDEKLIMLNSIENESQQVYDNFRDFIWSNEPKNLTANSLFMYLTDFNQHFFAYKDIQVEGQLNNNEDYKISPIIIRHIIPLFKELMTNIHKHSNANKVNWTLSISTSKLTLQINDNGVGFDTTRKQNGNGLKIINKRIQQMEAEFYLESIPNKGTQISLHIY